MARIRTIKPEFWNDQKIGNLSHLERLLFIGMWTLADDEGLLRAHPSYLRATIFPYDETLKISSIETSLDKLRSSGFIFCYAINGQKYAWVIKFRIHQRIDKPQKPSNPVPSIQNLEFKKAIFSRDRHICHICGAITDLDASSSICKSKAPSIDHLVPKSKGGTNFPSNLATACLSCNKGRGDAELENNIEDSENIPGIFQESSPLEGKGREGNGKEVEETLGDVVSQPETPTPPSSPLLVFKCIGGKTWDFVKEDLDKRHLTWPEMDVLAEVRGLWQWCEDNPEKRKTPRGMPAFLTRNLNRAYHGDRFKRRGQTPPEDSTVQKWKKVKDADLQAYAISARSQGGQKDDDILK